MIKHMHNNNNKDHTTTQLKGYGKNNILVEHLVAESDFFFFLLLRFALPIPMQELCNFVLDS